MNKIILEFDNKEEALDAMNGWLYKDAVEEIWQRVFRPAFKHGYADPLLDSKEAHEVIEKLAEIYREITRGLP